MTGPDKTPAGAETGSGEDAAPFSARADPAASAPSEEEQREARRKQEAAERSWKPEDGEWAEQAVEREADVLFRAIFEDSAVGIALVDLKSRIAKCNPALEEMLGYEPGELVGHAFTDIAFPEDAAVDQKLFEELTGGSRDHYVIEKRYIRKDGGVVPGQITASVIDGADDVPKFVIGIIEDVSERHRAEEAIRQRDLRIREAYSAVIAAVTGGKLVLVTPEEAESELGDELCRAETITSAARLSAERRQLRGIVEGRFDSACDPDEFALAAGEAMSNALKHGGKVCLRLLEKNALPQVEVSDEGPGIDFTQLPKATLVPGFSTATSLGMGFTIMLNACDRVLLSTSSSGTTIVLEARPSGDERGAALA